MKRLVIIAVLAVIGMAISLYVLMGISYNNRYIDLNNGYKQQQATLETFHDKMWKTIQSQAKVVDKQKDGFKEVYVGIMEGRYSKGDGTLMKWIQESNPQFDQTSYQKLMTTIEAQRNGFFAEQKIMQEIVKEVNDLRTKFPSSFWLASKPEASFIPISSTKSKEVMETHKDDELHL